MSQSHAFHSEYYIHLSYHQQIFGMNKSRIFQSRSNDKATQLLNNFWWIFTKKNFDLNIYCKIFISKSYALKIKRRFLIFLNNSNNKLKIYGLNLKLKPRIVEYYKIFYKHNFSCLLNCENKHVLFIKWVRAKTSSCAAQPFKLSYP